MYWWYKLLPNQIFVQCAICIFNIYYKTYKNIETWFVYEKISKFIRLLVSWTNFAIVSINTTIDNFYKQQLLGDNYSVHIFAKKSENIQTVEAIYSAAFRYSLLPILYYSLLVPKSYSISCVTLKKITTQHSSFIFLHKAF